MDVERIILREISHSEKDSTIGCHSCVEFKKQTYINKGEKRDKPKFRFLTIENKPMITNWEMAGEMKQMKGTETILFLMSTD